MTMWEKADEIVDQINSYYVVFIVFGLACLNLIPIFGNVAILNPAFAVFPLVGFICGIIAALLYQWFVVPAIEDNKMNEMMSYIWFIACVVLAWIGIWPGILLTILIVLKGVLGEQVIWETFGIGGEGKLKPKKTPEPKKKSVPKVEPKPKKIVVPKKKPELEEPVELVKEPEPEEPAEPEKPPEIKEEPKPKKTLKPKKKAKKKRKAKKTKPRKAKKKKKT